MGKVSIKTLQMTQTDKKSQSRKSLTARKGLKISHNDSKLQKKKKKNLRKEIKNLLHN